MGLCKILVTGVLLSICATASADTGDVTVPASGVSVLERTDPRLFALIADAESTPADNRFHIERWYEHPDARLPTVVITETISNTNSNTDGAYEISASNQMLHYLVLPSIVDDPYSVEAFPSDTGRQVVMRAKIDESRNRDREKPYPRAYKRTYERALNNFESNILDIGRQLARVESLSSGKLHFRQSWVSDSFRISRGEPPRHLIAADQIDNEFFSLRMTRWWNADDYALHVDYYLLVRDVEILPEDEHRFHDAVVLAQNLLKFTVADENDVVIAEADQ